MKNSTPWVILGVIALLFLCVAGSYNGMVGSSNDVRNKWADLQSAYQRRVDLVRQELPIVTGGAAQELAVFKTLRDQAGALAGSFKYDEFGQPIVPTGTDAAKVSEQIQAFDRAWINAMVYTADNPEITSTGLFSDFMVQVEGSENRINVARRDYNRSITTFRNNVQMFPGNIIAGMFGFNANQFPYFQAEEGAEQAPEITFPTPDSQ